MTALSEQIAREFGTPAVAIDLDKVEANIARLQAACEAAGLANRPHIKTHKSPVIGRMQIEAGASGITCQKLGEAEVFADAGFDDILISYNVFGEAKEARMAALLRRWGGSLTIAADNPVTIEGVARAAALAGREIGLVIECDTGRRRAGVETAAEAVALARKAAETPGIRFKGLMLYTPETAIPASQAFLDEAKAGLAAHGLSAEIVSNGGTPNVANLGRIGGITEHRAGTYVFNDRMMVACGAATLDDVALTVVSTVVSRGGEARGILDAGSKTLTSDTGGGLDGHGLILEHPEARIDRFAEEHGMLDLSRTNDRPAVGTVVRIVPNHVCVVVNMVDRLIATRGDEIVGEIEVAARGRLT